MTRPASLRNASPAICAAVQMTVIAVAVVVVFLLQFVLAWGFVPAVALAGALVGLGIEVERPYREAAIFATITTVAATILNVLFPFGSPDVQIGNLFGYNFMFFVFSIIASLVLTAVCVMATAAATAIHANLLKQCRRGTAPGFEKMDATPREEVVSATDEASAAPAGEATTPDGETRPNT